MKITISRSDFEKIRRHAETELPDEACGLIAGYDTDDGLRVISKVYLLTNIDHTNEHFSIDPAEHLAAVKDMRANKLTPLGNWHSHPETPSRPSQEDLRWANDSRASYLILSLADRENPVLNGFHVEGTGENRTARKEELIITDDLNN